MVTKSKDMTLKIWRLTPELEEIKTLTHNSDTNLSISTDGVSIVLGYNDGSVIIHNTNNWTEIQLASY
jgi:hypothetical protein